MSEPTMVEQLGEHVLKQLPKSMGYDQRIKIMHGIQDFVRQWVDREQKAEWNLDLVNERLQTERDECRRKLDVMHQHIDRLEDVSAIYETERNEAILIAKGLSIYYSWKPCPKCRCAIPTGLVCGVCGTDPTTAGR